MRVYWCPANVDAQAQLDEALRKINNNEDEVTFHAHGVDDECPSGIFTMKKKDPTSTECWMTS